MMTGDQLWNTYIDELLSEFERYADSYVSMAARGTGMSAYQIRDALREARAHVERTRNPEEDR